MPDRKVTRFNLYMGFVRSCSNDLRDLILITLGNSAAVELTLFADVRWFRGSHLSKTMNLSPQKIVTKIQIDMKYVMQSINYKWNYVQQTCKKIISSTNIDLHNWHSTPHAHLFYIHVIVYQSGRKLVQTNTVRGIWTLKYIYCCLIII